VDGALLGSWSATRWQYRSRAHPESVVDVVCSLGGSVTLSLSAESYVLTWSSGAGLPHDNRSVGGALVVEGDRLSLRPPDALEPDAVTYRLSGETLALSSDASEWDFDGEGKVEAAEFVAVLVRL
jgi:hypothetical protein